MTKDKYHHGTLKQDMIIKGLLLLNKEGLEGFSLRKVASMCGVSHTAPYKHFKDKNELIQAIAFEVAEAFKNSLLESTINYPDNPKLQIIEMGKSYVKFMVENPEYMKFLFLNERKFPILTNDTKSIDEIPSSFDIFKKSATNYLSSIDSDEETYYSDTIAIWSLVHGLALLISNNIIDYDGDYLKLVDEILNKKTK